LKGIGHFLEPDLKHEKIDLITERITERMSDHKKVEKIQESFKGSQNKKPLPQRKSGNSKLTLVFQIKTSERSMVWVFHLHGVYKMLHVGFIG
jgi:hypothetical protein